MIEIGRFNKLRVVKEVPFGVYLDGQDWGEILLPRKYVPQGIKLQDDIDVFIYFDSEDKIIATTLRPHVQLGEYAFLKVIDSNRIGAFMDWGLDKDLLVPGPEQYHLMEKDKSYIIYVKKDPQGRLIGSSKFDLFLNHTTESLQPGDEVNLLIAESSELGTKVIINNRYRGLIHRPDLFQTLHYGEKKRGYIKNIRDDGKIDVVLRKIGQESIHELADKILSELKKQQGFLPLHDKSTSLEIQRAFNESKKSFKRAIGHLYKQGSITIEENGIRLKNLRP